MEATTPVIPEYTPPEGAEKFAFEAEVHRMLDIVVNSLYQNKDVFLRELISNSADALDKYRYLSLTEPDTFKSEGDDDSLEINIEYDSENKTLTVRDSGIGMTKEQMIENLGTVARSGTTKFVEALKEAGNKDAAVDQIGQFGVGFYSTFLVSDRVSVSSRHPTSPKQYVWESTNGASDFVVFEDPRGNTLKRGTEITLHLREDAASYLEPTNLKSLATHYSEFVTHPIKLRTTSTMEVEVDDEDVDDATDKEEKKDDVEDLDDKPDKDETDTEDDLEIKDDEKKPKITKEVTTYSWDVLNNNKAIWTRDKESVSDDEYQGFFHLLNDGDNENATTWSHFNAEGNINFKSLLYLPTERPAAYKMGNIDTVKGAVRLYVRRVLIGDEFELLPRYLSFVKGIVDSDELPLNVNRETLQESKILKVIQKKLTRKALDLIREFAKKSADAVKEADEAEISADGDVAVKEGEHKKDTVDKYLTWYEKFSANIKYGIIEDEPNRGKLMKLLRFITSKSDGKLVSLAEYVENMKDWQEDIYVLGGASADEITESPLLETFRAKDLEVIYMTETIDEYLVKHARDFDRKKFVDVSGEGVKFKDEDEDLVKRREKAYQKKLKPLTKWLKKLYGSNVLRVQVAKRSLGSMPAVVSSSDFGNSANMDRIMRAQTFQSENDMRMSFKVFEINPRHPLILKLLDESPPEETDGETPTEPSQDAIDSAMMMHDIAMLNGGYPISDPVAHNKRMTKVLQKQYGLDSLTLEPEIDPPVEDDDPPEPDIDLDGLNMGDFGGMGGFDMGGMDDLDLDAL